MGKYKYVMDPYEIARRAEENWLNKTEEMKTNYSRAIDEVATDPFRLSAIGAGAAATAMYWRTHPEARKKVRQVYAEIGEGITRQAEELAKKVMGVSAKAPVITV